MNKASLYIQKAYLCKGQNQKLIRVKIEIRVPENFFGNRMDFPTTTRRRQNALFLGPGFKITSWAAQIIILIYHQNIHGDQR